ncbi:MAG: phosphate import ATP-binding protein PstB [Planctomycetota bacterium]|nr:MAG: phosphate import ATP-binding protein PstB [Planctomycetota bacterium]
MASSRARPMLSERGAAGSGPAVEAPPPGAPRCSPAAAAALPPLGPPPLAVRELQVAFAGRPVLEGLTLALPAGRVSAIVGPSGAGKTTLLSCFNRLTELLPDCQVRGSVRVGEQEVLQPRCDVVALRRRVGMIFQRPNPFPFSIRKNLVLPLREHGVRGREELQARVERALRAVGLWEEVRERLEAPASTLSGGQQQRLCIARAIALEPQVLLFDEPTAALDPLAAGVIEDLIAGMRGRYTIAVVTHDLGQARRLADHLAVLWPERGIGRLVEAGPAARVFDRPRHPVAAAYLAGRRWDGGATGGG